jgi:acyl-CoA hydrolase
MRPEDANPAGNVYGGSIMKLLDGLAAAVATRHSRSNVVTASIDRMDFLKPVYIGDLLVLNATINCVGESSMEVGVRIDAENMLTGEVRHTGTCQTTFVALDENGKPKVVPNIVPETDEEKRRYEEAMERRKERLAAIAAH